MLGSTWLSVPPVDSGGCPAGARTTAWSPGDRPALRETVRDAVGEGQIGHTDLVDAVAATRRFRHLWTGLADPGHTLLKTNDPI